MLRSGLKRLSLQFARSATTARAGRLMGREILSGAQNAYNYDMRKNGEAWLIHRLADTLTKRTILDIGANGGMWSGHVLDAVPDAQIYAVEMIPTFAQKIRDRFGEKLIVIECGLSDSPGTTTAYKFGGGGRLVVGNTPKLCEPFDVVLKTGDQVVSENAIANVAMIKIDVDGYELPVIRGLAKTIERDRPVIQFEYSRFYIETRHYLKDAFEFFGSRGYSVGRLMPGWVWFGDYSNKMENFSTNNFVAVPSSSLKAKLG